MLLLAMDTFYDTIIVETVLGKNLRES